MLTARVTHLEMLAPPSRRVPPPIGFKLALMRAEGMPLHFYRYLYERVGKPHHWMGRRTMSDDELSAVIHGEEAEIEVIYVDGAPAGFFELDLSRRPHECEIVYFGLMAEYQGRGLARFFLSAAIHAAWEHEPGKVTIHTNTLDSPKALRLYQQLGFAAVAYSQEEVEPWL